jgi:WD40 repeat protein
MQRPVNSRRLRPRLVGLAVALLALAAAPWVASQGPTEKPAQPAPPKKLPIPDKAAVDAAHKLLTERVYAAEVAAARKSAAAAVSLAGTLLSLAPQTDDDEPLRYAGLLLARDLAAQGGNIDAALQAVKELVKLYAVKGLPLKAGGLTAAAKNASGKQANEAVAVAALALIEEAVFEDELQIAQGLAEAALEAAVKSKTLQLVARARKGGQDVEVARREHDRIKVFADRVAKAEAGGKADPEASHQLGRYRCLIKGNWEGGLPLLAKGDNAAWRAFAQSQLDKPDAPDTQVKVAETCLELAAGEKGPAQLNLRRRAMHWYELALPKLKGPGRARVEQAVAELAALPGVARLSAPSRVEIAVELRSFPGLHPGGISVSRVAADGKLIITGGQNDKTVRVLDAQSGKEVRTFLGHPGNTIRSVALSPDGKYAASGDTASSLRVWDMVNGGLFRQCVGHTNWVSGAHFMPDGKTLLSASDDKSLRTWDLMNANMGNATLLTNINVHTNFINGLSVSRDSTRAATCSDDFSAAVWDLKTMQLLQRFKHNDRVVAVALAPDGKRVVSISQGLDRTVRLWDVASGNELRKLPLPPTSVGFCAVLSPDGSRVYVGCGFLNPPGGVPGGMQPTDNSIRVFEADTGKEVRQLTGHTAVVRSVSITADGRLLVSAGNDNMVRVWGEKK